LAITQDTNEGMFDSAIEKVKSELHSGNIANVLQQSVAIATEMDVRNYVSAKKRQLLLSYVDEATGSAVATVALAENVVGAIAALQKHSCQGTSTSIATAARLIDQMAKLVSGSVTSISFARYVVEIISSSTGALLQGACNGKTIHLPSPLTWMRQTRA
jgi:hypothetical protein